jgi:hypothetical protein
MERDLEQIQRVTANYFFWQGLRWVPLGFVILLLGVAKLPGQPLSGIWYDIVPLVALAAAIVASSLIGRYYRYTFGQVQDNPSAHAHREIVKWLVVYPALFGTLIIDVTCTPVVYLTGPVWGAGILAYWWSTGRGRRHYLVAALAMAALNLVQGHGVVAPGKPMFGVFAVLLGAIYIVGGLLDHCELRRVLRPVSEREREAAV